MRYGIVYALTSPTGRIYIGQTVQEMRLRWHRHCYNARQGVVTPLYASLRKYDPKLWDVSLFAECDSKEELDLVETLAIQMFGDMNLQTGGARGRHSESTKQKLRDKAIGRKTSEATRAKMRASHPNKWSAARRAAYNSNPPTHSQETKEHLRAVNTGKKMSPESRVKMSESRRRRP